MRTALVGLLIAACTGASGAGLDAQPARDAPSGGDARSAPDARGDARSALPACFRVTNARAPGGAALDLVVRDGRFVEDNDCEGELDAEGRYVVPAFVDSHVHLAYLPRASELARGGVAAAVDLASPLSFFDQDVRPLRIVRAGPMITAPRGYPTTSWGAAGYGLECADRSACLDAVDRVIDAGAGVVKVPLAGGPELDEETMRAVIDRAHERGLRVAVHALSDDAASRAAAAGADVLAHTPIEPLAAATIDAWSSRAVISTLGAFGGDGAIDNLRRLREAGATVLYGTDLGNTVTAVIDARELALLSRAGLDAGAILAAGTSEPARFWGLAELGTLEPGGAASFLLLDEDPLTDLSTLARPAVVVLDGRIVASG